MPSAPILGQSEPSPEDELVKAAKQLNLAGEFDKMKVKHGDSEQHMPVIDMAVLEQECQPGSEPKRMSERMAQACETWGFFQLVNHGIDVALLDKAREVSKGFFKLPDEAKLEIRVRPGVVQGYYSSSLTAVGSNKLTHSVDHLFFYTSPPSRRDSDRWPRDPPAYRDTITEYGAQVRSLAQKLIPILSEQLGLERGALEEKLAGGSTGEPTQSMRINYYTPAAATEASPEESGDLCRLKAHSDPGGLTALLQNDVAGFEIKKDGRWIAAEPVENALVVNIGDQLEMLSNGRYKSIEHRGNAHRTRERLTIATFYSPDLDAVISPVPEIVTSSHPALYKSIKYQDYFSNFVVKGLDGKEHIRAAVVRAN